MNWLFTRSNTKIRFEQGEPYCHLFPVERGSLERIEPETLPLSKAPDLEREYKLWCEGRNAFNTDLQHPGSEATQQRWQKAYFRGLNPSGDETHANHRSRLRLKDFAAKD
jgi:hypothetical protein